MSSQVRNNRILKHTDITFGSGLELGPLTSPIVLKSEADIYYADHMSQGDLRKKYANEPVVLDQIVPVDYVLGSKKLAVAVLDKSFSYIIASHVIEHVPDIVSWLKDVASVMNEGGILSLVIPDKRYTFDIERNLTRPADIIGAFLDQHTQASSSAMFDFASTYRKDIVPTEVWQTPFFNATDAPLRYSTQGAYAMCIQNLGPDTYVDSHCYVFTPRSFIEILRALIDLDLLDFTLVGYEETHENEMEFYVSLKRSTVSRRDKLNSLPNLAAVPTAAEIQKEINDLQEQLSSLKKSRSWQYTKPLRIAAGAVRGIRNRAKR